jgi:hypothetical protein
MVSIGYAGFREGNFLPLITTINHIISRHFTIFAGDNQNVLVSRVDQNMLKDRIADVFAAVTSELNPAPLWFDKSGNPEMIEAIPILRRLWPESVFIFAKRRAIENIVSRQKKFPNMNFEYHCADWARNMAAWRNIRETIPAGTFIEIDQQDLLQKPSEAAVSIVGLLELAPENTDRLLKTFSENRPQQTGEGSAEKLHSIDTVEWTDQQKSLFLEKCMPEMEKYGYCLGANYWKRPVSSYEN